MFLILEQMHALPDLVIDNILTFLPIEHVNALTHSAYPELQHLAERRQWRSVHIGDYFPTDSGSSEERFFFNVSRSVFLSMVQSEAPPPFAIHRLVYVVPRNPSDDPLFMTAEWRAYVAKHTASIHLAFDVGDGEPLGWVAAVPHFSELNIAAITVNSSGSSDQPSRSVLQTTLPRGLQLLALTATCGLTPAHELSRFVIPSSVVRLRLYFQDGVRPTQLPVLPPGLREFIYEAPSGLDLTESVHLFPSTLERLEVLSYPRSAMISQTAVDLFPRLLKHNLLVYLGVAAPNAIGLLVHGTQVAVNLAVPVDYAEIAFCPGGRLRVFATPPEVLLLLLGLNHWIAQATILQLELPLPMEGVVVPPDLPVTVRAENADIPLEVWAIRRLGDLTMGPIHSRSVPAQLGSMEFLVKLGLTLSDKGGRMQIPAPPNLLILRVTLQSADSLPDLRALVLVRHLEIRSNPKVLHFDPLRLPPGTTRLSLKCYGSHKTRMAQPVGNAWQSVSLSHLSELNVFAIHGVKGIRLGVFEFPDSLLDLLLHQCSLNDFEGVRFPRHLRLLALHDVACCDPWTTESPLASRRARLWMPSWGQRRRKRVPVVYPDLLEVLDLGWNLGLKPPPPDFAYPMCLRDLDVAGCGISDITLFRFPSALDRLVVSGNEFPIPEEYEWPQVKQLIIGNGGVTPEVQALLERKIPGVAINL